MTSRNQYVDHMLSEVKYDLRNMTPPGNLNFAEADADLLMVILKQIAKLHIKVDSIYSEIKKESRK